MVFCVNCGAEIPEKALFCPKCGVKTLKGDEAIVQTPADELKESLSKMGNELDKVFLVASREIQEAFQSARENLKRSFGSEPLVCSECGGTSPKESNFCRKCGSKLNAT